MDTILYAFEESQAYFISVVTLFGLAVGSFLNVVAIRVPKGESVIHPPSHCGSCGHRLGLVDLVPVFSYFWLRGRCRHCGESYSKAYMLWEAAAGILFAVTAWHIGPVPELLAALWMVSILVALVQTDLRHMLLPDRIVVTGVVGMVVLRLFIHPLPIWDYALAFVVGGGTLLLIAWLGELILKKESMGGGDIKLFALLGLWLGLKGVLLTLFVASAAGAIGGFLLIALRIRKRDDYIPFGPYIALGALISCLWGQEFISWYVSLLTS
jgi:leader peptidase (prepilin peptidase) / N-methyltransferase